MVCHHALDEVRCFSLTKTEQIAQVHYAIPWNTARQKS